MFEKCNFQGLIRVFSLKKDNTKNSKVELFSTLGFDTEENTEITLDVMAYFKMTSNSHLII